MLTRPVEKGKRDAALIEGESSTPAPPPPAKS